jgi:hypothetical protein
VAKIIQELKLHDKTDAESGQRAKRDDFCSHSKGEKQRGK